MDSIEGAAKVVTRAVDSPNCAIAGNPAKVVREGVDWRTERIARPDAERLALDWAVPGGLGELPTG